MNKICLVFGTRPELIKLVPIIYEFEIRGYRNELIIVNTNQHTNLVHDIIEESKINIDYTLIINNKSNNLSVLTSQIISKLDSLFQEISLTSTIKSVIVQGDTTSAFAAAIVSFYNHIDVHYVEAGLRTHDNTMPFPEEFNRKVISQTAKYLYAPTAFSKKNLIEEGFKAEQILITGNTIIDGILIMNRYSNFLEDDCKQDIILCTIHRRENHEDNVVAYLESIIGLAKIHTEIKFIIIRHPNPKIKNILDLYSTKQSKNLIISDPISYSEMLKLIQRSRLIISDSGGLQEEASFFLKPMIILRLSTERVESILNNIAVCVDLDTHSLASLFDKMLDMKIDQSCKFIYGTGNAAEIIVDNILKSALLVPKDLIEYEINQK